MEQELRDLGLTDIEIKVYLALLEAGPSQAGVITQKSGVHRRMVYDAVERLIKKGLIGYIVRNNCKLFSAVDPTRLSEFAEERKIAIERIIPELRVKFSADKEKKETLFFEGKTGIKHVFEEQLKEKEILIIAASPVGVDLFKFYFIWYDKKRIKKKIPVKVILPESLKGKFLEKIPLVEKRYVPDKYLGESSTNVFGNTVAIFHWDKKKPFAIVIKQQEIADSYRKQFQFMWDKWKN